MKARQVKRALVRGGMVRLTLSDPAKPNASAAVTILTDTDQYRLVQKGLRRIDPKRRLRRSWERVWY